MSTEHVIALSARQAAEALVQTLGRNGRIPQGWTAEVQFLGEAGVVVKLTEPRKEQERK